LDRVDGVVRLRPFVYDLTFTVDQESLEKRYTIDYSSKNYVTFLGTSESTYRLYKLFPMKRRLITPSDNTRPFFLLGSDRQGRDLYSRMISGARVSLTIGLLGVLISLVFGVLVGGISGYCGGYIDIVIQRSIEFVHSLPTIPLWISLSVAIPKSWDPIQVYFAVSIVLSFFGWATMARTVRGRFLALNSQDFIAAARLDGAGGARIIFRHMAPLLVSHMIAVTTLSIPAMVIAETSLSFLGLGLQPPVDSWGVLLQQVRSVYVVAEAPWLLLPAVLVVITVLAINFLGDGLRDAADPYHTR
jgi:peptide/nickel transport system permease protein